MSLTDPSRDPRPRRIVELCVSMGLAVDVLGLPFKGKECAFPKIQRHLKLSPLGTGVQNKLLRRIWALCAAVSPVETLRCVFDSWRFNFKGWSKKLSDESFDLIVIEDLQLLPLAFQIKNGAKLIFDAREYYPKQNEESPWFNFAEKPRRIQLCRKYMVRCDTVVTVSEGLREAFKKEFGISSVLYRSTPSYVDMPVRLTDKDHIKMVYHGAANRNRQLEKLIEILVLLDDRFSLDFFLVGSPGYQSELKELASKDSRIRFMKPVALDEIIPIISKYDIGFFYYEPSTFNLKHCLPNKFFEYIQARIMVAIGPSPDMAELVKKYGCGVVSESFSVESMAEALNGLSCEDIDRAKRCCDVAAKELCFEEESKIMRGIIQNLIGE
ncbi:glycosyltransferase [Dethiosulfovibrio sp. F2B]|uniref:glycosyltransferase n=1 Tax=Dethiosulfovibrio faecalis TaxID=2720018 RepID=UPI001F3C2E38|nr:glycosyltransferase [Dethiosulfovibrio faecalis]MCF4152419.1 glycosyltransferase [Dethiosulfovibrio faecalis]